MKKALHFAFAFLLFTTAVNAQITKGDLFLGGTVGYSQGNAKNTNDYFSGVPTKQRAFTITPAIGKVIRTNLVLGVQANILTQNQTYENYAANNQVTKFKNENYGGGVFLRKYVPLGKNFYFFGQGISEYNVFKSSQILNINQAYIKGNGWSINVSAYPGLAYAITKKFHIETGFYNLVMIGYSHSNVENKNFNTGTISSSKGNSFNFSTSLATNGGFGVGFRLLL